MAQAGQQADATHQADDKALADLVASTDTGGRNPDSRVSKLILMGLALAWSLFQLWYASPLPFMFNFAILNDTEARAIHLAFAIFLAFAAYPTLKSSPRHKVPIQDWIVAAIAAFCASYQFFFYEALSQRVGLPNTFDLVVAAVGMVCLLEATRRALGPPLMIVAIVFLAYIFFGASTFVPDVIQWKGASFGKAMWHLWLQTEGVFGVPLGVSTSFVFLFVLFGSLLDKAGAGNYFIQVAFAFLGHLRGGPAKAAVVSSGMTGLISGSSIANVVTTGTFTVPLMKKVGFSSEKAGAVEVASSVNGQLMPPVMGAAAFLMVEYVGIPYFEVIKHAFLPAIISYIALLYIVHLEALKQDLRGLPKPGEQRPAKWTLLAMGITVASIAIVAGGVFWLFELAGMLADNSALLWAALIAIAIQGGLYFGVRQAVPAESRWRILSTGGIVLCNVIIGAFALYGLVAVVISVFGALSPYVMAVLVLALYVVLVWYSTKFPPLELEGEGERYELPQAGPTVKAGLHYLPPVGVLVWCLMVERLSPGLSAFWAAAFMIVILLTQRPIRAFFTRSGRYAAEMKSSAVELLDGLITGARNMIGIGVATAAAGIIVGAVTLTGIGQVMTEFVEFVSGGSVILMLLFTAILSLILGMGLPTTANYIVVATLMAPVVVNLGSEVGLVVELIAVHLFVFYFGIMADVTPPVGLASFAAAAVSGGDPIRTGFTAFFYSLRTVLLPFIFIFNPELLLIGIAGPVDLILVIFSAVVGILVFAAATQGFFIARNRIWETVLLLLVAFTLLRPGFFMDAIYPPMRDVAPQEIQERAGEAPANTSLRIVVEGLDIQGEEIKKTVLLPLGPKADKTGAERLESAGLMLVVNDEGEVVIDQVMFGSTASKLGLEFDYRVTAVQVPTDQPPKDLFFIPGLLLLGGVYWLQRRRRDALAARPAAQAAQ